MSLFETIRSAIAGVDAVNRGFAGRVSAIIAGYPEGYRFTTRDARLIQRKVQQEIAETYGATQATSLRSPIYRAIVAHTDLAAEEAYRTTFDVLQQSMERVDPDLWDEVRRSFGDAGYGAEPNELAEAYMSLNGPQAQKERFLRSGFMDPQRRWVSPGGYRLSDRIWKMGKNQRKAIDTMIRQAIVEGMGPETLATHLQKYLNPDYAPVKFDRNGRVTRRGRNPSGASAARRLARTEVQRVHHDATVDSVGRIEAVRAGVIWQLSASHPKIDICDTYAQRGSPGLPPRVYRPEDVPHIPHPHCLCVLVPWVPSSEEAIQQIHDYYTGEAGIRARSTPTIDTVTGDDLMNAMPAGSETPIGPSPFWSANPDVVEIGFDRQHYWDLRTNWELKAIYQERFARAGYTLDIMDDVAWPPSMWNYRQIHVIEPSDFIWSMNNLAEAMNYRASQGYWMPHEWFIHSSGPRGESSTVAWVNTTQSRNRVNININNAGWYHETPFTLEDDGGFVSVNSPYGHINHEIAHILQYENIDSQGVWVDRPGGAWYDPDGFVRDYDGGTWFDAIEPDIANDVSIYAAKNPEELVAEVYAYLMEGHAVDEDVLYLYRQFWGPDLDGGLFP